jgi:hypothetical protein
MTSNAINHQGLLISLFILAMMSITCHITNLYYYLMKKIEHFGDMSKYNKISHYDLNNCTGLPCDKISEESHPDIPCNILEKCMGKQKSQLDPESEKILLLTMLKMTGKTVMNRGINNLYPDQ